MILEKKCCLTCSYYPCPYSKGELDEPCEDYDPLVFDYGNVKYRDDVIIKLYGLDALREFYSDEEMEDYFGFLLDDRDLSIELDRKGLLDESDRQEAEETLGPIDWPSKHLNVEGSVTKKELRDGPPGPS